MKISVLFVDDDPNVLKGLSRMLRSLRREWHTQFAQSGEEALALMEKTTFDVVVSDLRMPSLDGVELLTEIMNRYPSTVRILLSGQAEQSTLIRAVTPAHQFLSKPCDAETLRITVARACSLRNTLQEESLIQLVSKVTSLPSLPKVYTDLLEELQSENSSVKRVAELIAQDVGMTAKLLQMVNSSFFGVPRRVETPAHAASMLGLSILRPLVLSAGIFSQFNIQRLYGYSADELMQHSMAVSQLAEQIAKETNDKQLAEDAMLAGMLHDIGQLLLVANLPEDFYLAMRKSRDKRIPLCDAERTIFGANHANMGAYLLGLWGMSDSIVEAVAFHHEPSKSNHYEFGVLACIHIANALVNERHSESDIVYSVELDEDFMRRLGVAEQLPHWRALAESNQPALV